MHFDVTVLGFLVMGAPFLAIPALLVYYALLRARWRLNRWLGKKNPGFCPSSAALGMMLLFTQVYWRPSIDNVIEVKQDEDADEDSPSPVPPGKTATGTPLQNGTAKPQ